MLYIRNIERQQHVHYNILCNAHGYFVVRNSYLTHLPIKILNNLLRLIFS